MLMIRKKCLRCKQIRLMPSVRSICNTCLTDKEKESLKNSTHNY
jgi:hypothetical protein